MFTSFPIPIDDVVEWRRHLHANPELSFQEFETANYVENVLNELGIETWRPTPTSVVGDLAGTKSDGINLMIALRADMDALPVDEQTGEEFSSTKPGLMHACGHDAHTAMLLGTAATLCNMRDQFGGTVRFIFQHAEEMNPGGAVQMIENGVLERVDCIFGFHVMNGPKGTVSVASGPATSSAGGWFCTIQGKGSHGSRPQDGVDPALCASMCVVALNHIVSRNLPPQEFAVVNASMIQSGTAPNIIPDTARIGCSIRVYSNEAADIAYRRADEVVDGICKAYNCTYEFERVPAYPVTMNDPAVAEQARRSARKVLGDDMVLEGTPSNGSEDFSYYSLQRPAAFVLINGGDAEDGLYFQNHHPKFNIVEHPTLLNGVKTQVQIIVDMLS